MITAANALAAHNRSHVPAHPVHATQAEADQADERSRRPAPYTEGRRAKGVPSGRDDGAAHRSEGTSFSTAVMITASRRSTPTLERRSPVRRLLGPAADNWGSRSGRRGWSGRSARRCARRT